MNRNNDICPDMTESSHTPVMKQYLTLKNENKEHLLLFRMGDFYELFYEDAIDAAKLLDITLTSRGQSSDGKPIPMAGVPHHAADSYISKLIKQQRSVAICEQINNEPLEKNSLITREVVRIITPGTVLHDSLLDEKRENILSVVAVKNNKYGISTVDLSTGRFVILEVNSKDNLLNELSRIQPQEILIAENTSSLNELKNLYYIKEQPSYWFDYESAYSSLCQQFNVSNLSSFECDKYKIAIVAAGCLMRYLYYTQKSMCRHIRKLLVHHPQDSIILDDITRRNLEINTNMTHGNKNTLLSLMNHCKTSMGSRLLIRWLNNPVRNHELLNNRLDAIECLLNEYRYCNTIQQYLKKIGDLERILPRISLNTVRPRDLVSLKNTLEILPNINLILGKINSKLLNYLNKGIVSFHDLLHELSVAIVNEPSSSIKEGGVIAEKYNEELDKLRKIQHDADQYLSQLENKEKARLGINSLKVGYNKIHGYYIEISKLYTHNLPKEYIPRQTLKNVERFVTAELKEFELSILQSKENALQCEKDVFNSLLQKISNYLHKLHFTVESLSTLDVLCNLAERSKSLNYFRPVFSQTAGIFYKNGRHSVIEENINKSFIANDCHLNEKNSFMLITGPNMGGKSTYMRQTAIVTLLAHIGSYVPAQNCILGPIDRIFTRIGANDDLSTGRSTFMLEMNETALILNNSTQYSLVLLDEIGRGTSTYDGISLAWACAKYLATHNRSLVLFSTHFFELTKLADQVDVIFNTHMSVMEKDKNIVFLYKIKAGSLNKSYGLQVAELAGLPSSIIANARNKMKELNAVEEEKV